MSNNNLLEPLCEIATELGRLSDNVQDLGSYFLKLDENLVWLRGINEQLIYVVESIDCAGAKPYDFWMQSDIAAKDKAKELGIDILPEYNIEDLRYKIHCALQGVD